ncbi:MAG: DNA/RNA non-specific endonuclease [Pseudopedobacter saltans]|uniref:DNA/RNA non-specific endonuclease n=1 Tax=Pseudopedobacter saltans TaxID=151895 RepID=A0A2W5EBH5_9SPHI|nr:MAG: DNA/RNA non-specific endonuclease [Pseudopedobacter saltans]
MLLNSFKKIIFSASGLLTLSLLWTSCRKDVVNPVDTPSEVTIKDTLYPNIPITLASDTLVAADTLDNGNLLLGNPTVAAHKIDSVTNYLINTTYYVTSYNSKKGIPNWVSWHLTKTDIGSVSRSDAFANYTSLPTGWYQVLSTSYQGSVTGFDRGHNCPSGDRTSTTAANTATFYMINMIPQAPTLNQGPWEGLESKIRDSIVTNQSKEVYIVMGNYGVGGSGTKGGTTSTIDDGNITVPNHVWKVAVILDNGNGDLNRITSSTTVLAVDMPNTNTLYTTSNKTAWRNYITTINDIETASKAAGRPIDILSRLSSTVKTALKAKKYTD